MSDVNADAEGNDYDNLDDEYVVFENTGESPLVIGGWTISDSADHTYTVPKDTTVEPDETLTLYTGSGRDSPTALFWGRGRERRYIECRQCGNPVEDADARCDACGATEIAVYEF